METIMKAIAAVAMLVLGACSGGTVGWSAITGPYSRQELADGAGNRDLAVRLIGSVPGRDPAALASDFAASVPPALGVNTTFTAMPGASARPDYALVFVLNPTPDAGSRAFCDSATNPVPMSGRVQLSAAFCRAGSPLTVAVSEIDRAVLDQKPALAAQVAALSREALPIGVRANITQR
jgi:hypothetical protein